MAARHLQKLRSTQAAEQEVENSDASEDAAPSRKVTPFNPFDLLSDEEVPPFPWTIPPIFLSTKSAH